MCCQIKLSTRLDYGPDEFDIIILQTVVIKTLQYLVCKDQYPVLH